MPVYLLHILTHCESLFIDLLVVHLLYGLGSSFIRLKLHKTIAS